MCAPSFRALYLWAGVVAAGAALPAPAAGGRLDRLDVDTLKLVYLRCNAEAMQRLLGAGEAALCAVACEELEQRAFDGDFTRLLAWSRQQAAASAAPVPAAAVPAVGY